MSDISQEETPLELLNQIIEKFDTKFFLLLQKLKSPSQKLRNLILVFLTIYHEELDDLVEGLSDDENEQSKDMDKEWATIHCFFRSAPKVIAMIQKTPLLIENREIDESSFEKAAAIYESVIKETEDSIDASDNEFIFCEAFHEFIYSVFEYEKKCSGSDYLGIFEDESVEVEVNYNDINIANSVITEVSEEKEMSTVVSNKDFKRISESIETGFKKAVESGLVIVDSVQGRLNKASRDDGLIDGQEERVFEISDGEIYRRKKSKKLFMKSKEEPLKSLHSASEKDSEDSSEEVVVEKIEERSQSLSSLDEKDKVMQETPEMVKYSNQKKQMKKKDKINYERILEKNQKKAKERKYREEEDLALKKSPFKNSKPIQYSKNKNSRYSKPISEEASPLNLNQKIKAQDFPKEKEVDTPREKYARFLKKNSGSSQKQAKVSLVERYQKSVEKTKKMWKSKKSEKKIMNFEPEPENFKIPKPSTKPETKIARGDGERYQTPKEAENNVNDKTLEKKPLKQKKTKNNHLKGYSISRSSSQSSKSSKSTVEEFYVSSRKYVEKRKMRRMIQQKSKEKTPEPQKKNQRKNNNPEIFEELKIEAYDEMKKKFEIVPKHRKQKSDILFESKRQRRKIEAYRRQERVKMKVVKIKKDIAKERNQLMKKLNDKFIRELRERRGKF